MTDDQRRGLFWRKRRLGWNDREVRLCVQANVGRWEYNLARLTDAEAIGVIATLEVWLKIQTCAREIGFRPDQLPGIVRGVVARDLVSPFSIDEAEAYRVLAQMETLVRNQRTMAYFTPDPSGTRIHAGPTATGAVLSPWLARAARWRA